MVALYSVSYNFVKVQGKHRMSPAMAAGVTDRLGSVEEIANLIEAAEPFAANRGSLHEAGG